MSFRLFVMPPDNDAPVPCVSNGMANFDDLTRRGLLKALGFVPFLGFARAGFAAVELVPTPELPDPDEPTPSLTEGPFYKRNSPERGSLLEAGLAGDSLVIEGRVLGTDGKPIPGALLDFWQCDSKGNYDNGGFRLRGHQFAHSGGEYKLETIVPGLYTGRTRHIHVRVQPPSGRVLTTQLFFPEEPGNPRDRIFRERCLIKYAESGPGAVRQAKFDFVLRVG